MNKQFKPYPLVTVHMNRYGHLELWRVNNSRELDCDLYVQIDSDVEAILESMPKRQANRVRDGFDVKTYFISDEYFGTR